jgi:hypothetical protein
MNIQQLNIQAKTAISLFLMFIITATISSVILLGLELTGQKGGLNIPTISQLQSKYTTPELVASMRGSMYEHVADDDDIDMVATWIGNGAKKEDPIYAEVEEIISLDCADCHSKSSKMSKAIPSMPFETYKEIKSHTQAGYSWKKMSKQAHIHMFGIAMFLITLTLIFAYTTYKDNIKMILICTSFGGAFLDIFSWWFSKYFTGLVYMIYVMGGVMVSSILLMSLLILINLWQKE